MKAIVYDEFGPPDVLHIADVETPAPRDNEVQIRVVASPVGYGDVLARNFKNLPLRDFHMPLLLYIPSRIAFGLSRPRMKVLGSEFAGEVTAVGKSVTRFRVGDAVFGYRGPSMGAYAEYLCMAESKAVAIKPARMTFAEACAVPYGALMASSLLRKAPVQPGQKVLINGASGGIGSAALQIARQQGGAVTAVCGTPRLDYVRSLGADQVIDYTHEDFTRNGRQYDLIVDVLGKSSFEKCRASLTAHGCYLPVSFKSRQVWQALRTSRSQGQRVIATLASENPADLDIVRGLIEAGEFKVCIDKVYPMTEAAEAHRRVESGLKQGSVVITMRQ